MHAPITARKFRQLTRGAVTLLPELAVNVEARGLKLMSFSDPTPHRTIVLAWRKTSPMSDTFRKIGATLRTAATRRS